MLMNVKKAIPARMSDIPPMSRAPLIAGVNDTQCEASISLNLYMDLIAFYDYT